MADIDGRKTGYREPATAGLRQVTGDRQGHRQQAIGKHSKTIFATDHADKRSTTEPQPKYNIHHGDTEPRSYTENKESVENKVKSKSKAENGRGHRGIAKDYKANEDR